MACGLDVRLATRRGYGRSQLIEGSVYDSMYSVIEPRASCWIKWPRRSGRGGTGMLTTPTWSTTTVSTSNPSETLSGLKTITISHFRSPLLCSMSVNPIGTISCNLGIVAGLLSSSSVKAIHYIFHLLSSVNPYVMLNYDEPFHNTVPYTVTIRPYDDIMTGNINIFLYCALIQ